MFRLHKSKVEKAGEKTNFKFSNFQALQVPKGWDRLFVSIISVQTGKAVDKSSKAIVRNGSCQWTDTFSESVCVSQDFTTKELEECLYKFIVATGSARSSILGEAIINLTEYANSKAPVPISLPLKKCNHGTIFQVKIQCLSPRLLKQRVEKHLEERNFNKDELSAENDDIDNKSDGSDILFARSTGSSSSNNLGVIQDQHGLGENGNKEMIFSASGSCLSSDSGDGSIGRNFSYGNNVNVYNLVGRQDSLGSQNSTIESVTGDDPLRSNPSSFNSQIAGPGTQLQWAELSERTTSHLLAPLPLGTVDSCDNYKTAEDTVEELHGEAKKWEANVQKLKLDLEISRKEFQDQSRHLADLDMELSAACAERDGYKVEIGKLKSLLSDSIEKQAGVRSSMSWTEDIMKMIKELEDEIRFQKDSNANLALQLEKTQGSNIEFVSILQELEETIEKQRLEIQNLSEEKLELCNMLKTRHAYDNSGKISNEMLHENSRLHGSLIDCEPKSSHRKSHDQVEPDRSNVCLHLDELRQSQMKIQPVVEPLETSPEDQEIERERGMQKQAAADIEHKYTCKLAEKEEEIFKLEIKLSELLHNHRSENQDFSNRMDLDLVKENEALRAKVQELEKDCNELTEENLELLFKMKESKNIMNKGSSPSQDEPHTNISVNVPESEFQLISRIHQLEHQLKEMKMLGEELLTEKVDILTADLRTRCSNLELELETFKDKACNLDAELSRTSLDLEKKEFEVMTLVSQLENYHVKELSWENQIRDSSKKLENLEMELQSERDDHGKELATILSEIEACKAYVSLKEQEIESYRHIQSSLEDQISFLREEKTQLEENLDTSLREGCITAKCLDDTRQELTALTKSVDFHVENSKNLEREVMELENAKQKQEFHLRQLEEENVLLTERISSLDAQSRHLADEESSRLALQDSNCLIVDLHGETGLGKQVEIQEMEMDQKIQEQKQLAVVEQESEFLKSANAQLQSTIESLIEEYDSLQRTNNELRSQRLTMNEQCKNLENKLRESQNLFSECSKRVELLEERISSTQKNVAIKDNSLTSKLESLLHKHFENEDKLLKFESLVNQVHFEKTAEIENLEREITHLTAQSMSPHDERERVASEMVHELSMLTSDKTKLGSALQDCHAQIKLLQFKLCTVQQESENNTRELVDMLASSRRNEEMLMVEHDHMNKLVEDLKNNEEKLRVTLNELEERLKASEHERQLSAEEIASLKDKVQNLEKDMKKRNGGVSSTSTDQLEEDQRTSHVLNPYEREVDNNLLDGKGRPPQMIVASDLLSKIQSLETELAEALDANNLYKLQLKRFLSTADHVHDNNAKRLVTEDITNKEGRRSASSLEAELRDMRERYFHMSLKYAEVEAQREELVMKLKSLKMGRKWFSMT